MESIGLHTRFPTRDRAVLHAPGGTPYYSRHHCNAVVAFDSISPPQWVGQHGHALRLPYPICVSDMHILAFLAPMSTQCRVLELLNVLTYSRSVCQSIFRFVNKLQYGSLLLGKALVKPSSRSIQVSISLIGNSLPKVLFLPTTKSLY